ncbi:SGNH/GDSL hydrolase family protein [Amycolatopsis rhabdoformis]|uniref:SGNH/GDSL hydrolase family protein n=1 Tax=Amycolatopsis rhabdoformis TaxID=1448059 RepID=A0ABZ1IBN7_9PSEU|nr:SGNH/GDSL hydrolase family protein [Amycolatopsis rhabdoformis]WSE31431.1 SGNH/GDSL hydrolase family protein [Amycolatopsis rhabdoformis]
MLTLIILAVGMSTAVTSADAAGQRSWCAAKSNVAIVGTSADTGYGSTGYQSTTDTWASTTYGWTTKFANGVHAQWQTNVQNYSHNGALAADYLPGGRWAGTTGAIADMAAKQPDLVLVDLGGNDFWAQNDPAKFQTDLNNVIDGIRASRPGGVDILMSIYAELKWTPNPYGGNTQKYTWDQYASVIYQTAVAKGTALTDLRQYIPPAGSANLPNPSPWTSDNIHLNDAGNLAEYGMWWGWTASLGSIC